MESVIRRNGGYRYFHLSMQPVRDALWTPRLPAGLPEGSKDNIPRISTAPTIRHAFYGIYPNIKQFWQNGMKEHIFHCYVFEFNKGDETLHPGQLLDMELEDDAMLTQEIAFTCPKRPVDYFKVRIKREDLGEPVVYRPWNDPRQPLTAAARYLEKYEVIRD